SMGWESTTRASNNSTFYEPSCETNGAWQEGTLPNLVVCYGLNLTFDVVFLFCSFFL
ncbi:hypothetical protein L9F63_015926, partial [Diploptera punctata]